MAKITASNYIEATKSLDFSKMPEGLQAGHDVAVEAIEANLANEPDLKEVIDLQIEKLNKWLAENEKKEAPTPKPTPPAKKPRKRRTKGTTTRRKAQAAKRKAKKATPKPAAPKAQEKPKATPKPAAKKRTPRPKKKVDYSNNELVKSLPIEVQYIRKYLAWDGRAITKTNVLNFKNQIEKDNLAGKFTVKTSKYAKEVKHIQRELVKIYNDSTVPSQAKFTFVLDDNDKQLLADYKNVELHVVRPSISLVKRFLNLYARIHKGLPKTKAVKSATLLHKAIKNAMENGKVTANDPNKDTITTIQARLARYINGTDKQIHFSETELQGLSGIGEVDLTGLKKK